MPATALDSTPSGEGILLYYKYVDLSGGGGGCDGSPEAGHVRASGTCEGSRGGVGGGEQEAVAAWFEADCGGRGLRGRIRVAKDGVNVTVGGPLDALRGHMDAVTAHPVLRGDDIDFKLQESRGARNAATVAETRMDGLHVRRCEELVTLGPLARSRANPATTAPHLSPQAFHGMLTAHAGLGTSEAEAPEAAGSGCGGSAGGGDVSGNSAGGGAGGVVLLDARNVYETAVGRFEAGPCVPTLDPATRCFSDLPAWLDAHEAQLRGRTILMYCTGGVRCERASAYLREKGPGFDRVFQLSGGIQRYLEAYPDGGYFRGKNFLYDDRITVAPADADPLAAVVGRCRLCGCAWDDYGARQRCSRCRLLLLVCDDCHAARRRRQEEARGTAAAAAAAAGAGAHAHSHGAPVPKGEAACRAAAGGGRDVGSRGDRHATEGPLLCDLCAASSTQSGGGPARAGGGSAAAGVQAGGGGPPSVVGGGGGAVPRRLRILCLHGFRQTASQFQGRTCALRKKLYDLAEFVFVDGPHVLPLFIKAAATEPANGHGGAGDCVATACDGMNAGAGAADSSAGAAQAPAHERGRSGHVGSQLQGEQQDTTHSQQLRPQQQQPLQRAPAAAKRAWLLPPQLYTAAASAAAAAAAAGADAVPSWQAAPAFVDGTQYARQTEGWLESLAALRRAVAELGPFDGVFGFSQGAAVAAVLCALQQQEQQQQQQQQQAQQAQAQTEQGQEQEQEQRQTGRFNFRFAILASGFLSPAPEHRSLLQAVGPLALPSLHVYGSDPSGGGGGDGGGSSGGHGETGAPRGSEGGAAPPVTQTGGGGGGRRGGRRGGRARTTPLAVATVAAAAADDAPAETAAAGCGGCGGHGSGDRQISARESEHLAAAFATGSHGQRRVLRHAAGHLIPATRAHADAFRAFLSQFLDE